MALKFDKWLWKTIGHLFYPTSSFVHHFVAIGKFKLEFQPRNAVLGSTSAIFSHATFKFGGWPCKTIGHLFYTTSSYVHHVVTICEFHLELQSGNAQIRAKFVLTSVTFSIDLWPWSFAWASFLSMVITPEHFMMIQDMMTGTWWQEHCQKVVTDGWTDRQIDRQTDRSVPRAAWSPLKNLWHTFWSWFICYMNIKWIQLILWKVQSRHNSVHR